MDEIYDPDLKAAYGNFDKKTVPSGRKRGVQVEFAIQYLAMAEIKLRQNRRNEAEFYIRTAIAKLSGQI